MRRLVLLVTAPAVRAGLLSWPAWRVLQEAAQVLAGSAGDPLLPALDEAGVRWRLLPGTAGASGPAGRPPGRGGRRGRAGPAAHRGRAGRAG